MGFEILLTVSFVLLVLNFISLDITVSKMKKDRLNLDVVTAITALEMATKKLNEKLKYETQSLSDYKQRLKQLEKRLDILEEGHPDSDIDYGTVDDNGNITEVWFEGKRYVPEDKRNEDTNKLYADNKVVAEITRPEEKHCYATCKYYQPGVNHTCDMNPFKWVSSKNAACNKYEAASTPVEYIRYDHMYKKLGGNGMTEQLLKRAERLDYIYSTGLMSIATYRHMVDELLQEELTHNDS